MKFKNDIELQAGLEDLSGSTGTSGQILSSTETGTAWIDPSTIVAEAATLVVIACKNTSGAAIAQGTPVYQTGTVGATATIEIAPADALISENKLPAIGLLQTDLNNNGFGNVVITGELTNFTTSPIDGVVPTTGDKVFVKSGGGLTLTKPTGEGNGIQNMGLVGKVSGGNSGSITVSSIMRTNDVPNLPEGRIWVGDGNTIVSDTVYIDEPNNRVGIGTSSPGAKLDVSGVTKTDSILINATSSIASSIVTLNKASTSTGTDVGQFYDITKENTTNSTTSVIYGVVNRVDSTSAFENRGIITQNNIGRVTGAGDFSYVYPSYNQASAKGTGTVDYVVAGYNEASLDNASGTVNNLWGTHTEVQLKAGTVGNISLLNFDFDQTAGTTITGDFQYIHITNEQPVSNISGTARALNIESDLPSFFSGSIGIGTTDPGVKLDVNSSGVAAFFKSSTNTVPVSLFTTNNAISTIGFKGSTSTSEYHVRVGADSKDFVAYTNNTERLRILENGNVGIGTTSPNGTLTVVSNNAYNSGGGLRLQSSSGADRTLLYLSTDHTNQVSTIQSYRDGTGAGVKNLLINPQGGNVGIGTTSPVVKLQVDGTITSTGVLTAYTSVPSINIGHNGSSAFIAATSGGGANTPISFSVGNNNEKMRITSTGNVGIGTTSPSEKLQVNNGKLYITESANASTANLIYLENSGSGGNEGVSIKFNPMFDAESMIASNREGAASDDANLTFHTALADVTTERMRIASSGNVGIGTTSPGYKLEVVGNAKVSSNFYIGNVDAVTTATEVLVRQSDRVRGITPANLINASGGPYLPLSAGSSYPLTGDLYVSDDVLPVTNIASNLGSSTNSFLYTHTYVVQSAGVLQLNTGGTERMRITSGGNVGIGTTNPGFKLDVSSGSAVGARISTTGFTNLDLVSNRTGGNLGGIRWKQDIDSFQTSEFLGLHGGGFDWKTGDGSVSPAIKMSMLSNGNVGIGTTSPQQKLHIVDTDGANIILNSNTGAENNGIWMTEGGVATPYVNGAYFHYDSANNLVRLNTGTTTLSTRFVVQRDTGKFIVGGVTANQTQSVMSSRQNGSSIEFGHLNQSGQYYGTLGAMSSSGSPFIAFSADNSVSNSFTTRGAKGFVISQDTGISGDLIFSSVPLANTANQGLVERMRISDTGNVGIGTTSPGSLLHVEGSRTTASLQVNQTGTGVIANFKQGGNSKVLIDNTGNVGIGTTSPVSLLHIKGADPVFTIQDTSTGTAQASSTLRLGESGSGGVLDVYWDIKQASDDLNTHLEINHSSNGNHLTILDNGNVGIGTTNPSEKLDVVGNIELNGVLYIGSRGIYQQENTDVDGLELVANASISLYRAAFFDYVIQKEGNVRAGTVFACNDGGSVEYTETSTNDIGDTSDVVLSVDILAGNMRLLADAATSGWSVKSLIRAI